MIRPSATDGPRHAAHRLTTALLITMSMVILSGCQASSGDDTRPLVVATTSIVGDLVARVAGDEAQVEVLIPVGADPHDFATSARQATRLREAGLVVTSGLGPRGRSRRRARGSRRRRACRCSSVGPALDPRPLRRERFGHPRPSLVARPAARRPSPRAHRRTARAGGRWRLGGPGDRVRRRANGPRRRAADEPRHDSGRSPQARHHPRRVRLLRRRGTGSRSSACSIPGGATQAAPDPRALADLAAAVREAGVPAIFAETTLPTNVADALAAEVGSDVRVVVLYTGSLGEPGSGRRHVRRHAAHERRAHRRRPGLSHARVADRTVRGALHAAGLARGAAGGGDDRARSGPGSSSAAWPSWATRSPTEYCRASPWPSCSALDLTLGAIAGALVMVAGIALVHRRAALREDTGIGLLFVGMLALGVIIVSACRRSPPA